MARNSDLATVKLNILDIFVAATALTVVAIRVLLQITGYPQLGAGGLHIAHMLWGGLAMLFTLLYLLLIDNPNRYLAALTGGIGFGFFVDEIGKFVTSDNNYFYKPSAFLIYLLTLSIWTIVRLIIVNLYHGSFFSPPTWPRQEYLRRLIIVYLTLQTTIGIIALGASLIGTYDILGIDGFFEVVFGFIIAFIVCLVAYGLRCYLTGNLERSANLLRLGAVLTLFIIYPITFYKEQFSAIFGCALTIAVIFGLSQISFKSVFQPLFKND